MEKKKKSKKFMKNKILIFLFSLILISLAGKLYFLKVEADSKLKNQAEISSFEDCVDAGFPILESYPSQCRTPDGKSFTQNIGNELELNDEIIVTSPRPLSTVTTPLKITGNARGQWYFEGSFSAELFDGPKEEEKSLGKVSVKATDEWMSENFSPFEGTLKFKKPTMSVGTLIIKNANPSGLPEKEKTLVIPVYFEN